MNSSTEVENKVGINPDVPGQRPTTGIVFEAPQLVSPEYSAGQLTNLQRNTLTDRIRGVSIHTIAEDLSLPPQGVMSQLYGSYRKLDIAAPQEEYWRETALTQAALRGVRSRQLPVSAFAQDFNLHTGALLTQQQREMWDLILEDNGEQSSENDLALRLEITEAEIAEILNNSVDILGTVTQAQTALIYLAYKRDLELTQAERKVVHLGRDLFATNSDIAKRLYISINTVKTHRRAIFTKLGITSRRELVDFYRSTPTDPLDTSVYPQQAGIDGGRDAFLQVEQFTAAEILVLGHLLLAKTTDTIAADLGVSPNTIKSHLRSIYRKTNVSGKIGAPNYAVLKEAYLKLQQIEG